MRTGVRVGVVGATGQVGAAMRAILAERNAYSLLASRQPGTQRVPAIWTSFKAPRLGWCWDRNPHTWLGSASASGRVGPAS